MKYIEIHTLSTRIALCHNCQVTFDMYGNKMKAIQLLNITVFVLTNMNYPHLKDLYAHTTHLVSIT